MCVANSITISFGLLLIMILTANVFTVTSDKYEMGG